MSKVVTHNGTQIEVPDNFDRFECSRSGIEDGVYKCIEYQIVTKDGRELVCTKQYQGKCIQYENKETNNSIVYISCGIATIIIAFVIFFIVKNKKTAI